MLIVLIIFMIAIIFTYPKWSYKVWAKECEKTVIPWTGKKLENNDKC